jgi:hypothetical protein
MFGVFGVCDPWRGAQHTSCKDGGAILKWLVPINLIEVRSFVGASQYLQKFIDSFFSGRCTTPCHKKKW